jgi:hypothetical protein
MVPSPAELAALAEKYQALVQLRVARDHGGPEASRDRLRDLSRRFPGSLRELDTLGEAELRRRARAAAAGAPLEPWMAWIAAFHRLMRAALLIKADRRPAAELAAEGGDRAVAERVAIEAGVSLDPDLVRDFRRPPQGRLAPLVIAELARRFGVGAEEMRSCLFPRRRGAVTSASRSS